MHTKSTLLLISLSIFGLPVADTSVAQSEVPNWACERENGDLRNRHYCRSEEFDRVVIVEEDDHEETPEHLKKCKIRHVLAHFDRHGWTYKDKKHADPRTERETASFHGGSISKGPGVGRDTQNGIGKSVSDARSVRDAVGSVSDTVGSLIGH